VVGVAVLKGLSRNIDPPKRPMPRERAGYGPVVETASTTVSPVDSHGKVI